ncbi:MAG: hypothetical protein ACYSTY_12225, partial [Planctomycetota bacterium]
MAGFVYLLPGISPGQLLPGGPHAAAILAERGLGQTLADLDLPAGATIGEIVRGPGGLRGAFLFPHRSDGGDPPELQGYDEGRQQWLADSDP